MARIWWRALVALSISLAGLHSGAEGRAPSDATSCGGYWCVRGLGGTCDEGLANMACQDACPGSPGGICAGQGLCDPGDFRVWCNDPE